MNWKKFIPKNWKALLAYLFSVATALALGWLSRHLNAPSPIHFLLSSSLPLEDPHA